MITYQSKNSWQRPLLIALIGSAVVGTGVWWFAGHSGPDATTQVSSAASEPMAATSSTVAPTTPALAVSTDPTILSDGRPSDFTPGVWSALDKAMKSKPQLKPEVDKVLSYMRFQRSFEQWQSLEDARDAQQRHQLAQSLLNQMPDRLAKGEFSLSEALMMTTVLLSDLEPDEKKREQQVEEWGKKMAFAAPQPTDDAQVQAEQKKVEDLRILPGLLTEGPNPDPAKVQQALEERSRLSR
ncbi:hypothetical protein [Aquabacterium sp.]|uniref:hypothetical protein n=1 Tax=Aquabacterium sp. TaxID=1872578 RepID=UPI0024880A4A|nr:hypothetical protein [Aquabacterium sp.]MDI1258872.1 hypothetical protein [Aquabacterium sp.]